MSMSANTNKMRHILQRKRNIHVRGGREVGHPKPGFGDLQAPLPQ